MKFVSYTCTIQYTLSWINPHVILDLNETAGICERLYTGVENNIFSNIRTNMSSQHRAKMPADLKAAVSLLGPLRPPCW